MGTSEQIATAIFESTLGRSAIAQGIDRDEVMKMCRDAAGDILETT